MPLASRKCTCSSCGDNIQVGQVVFIQKREGRPGRDVVCFRCHPEMESAKVKMTISGDNFKGTAEQKRRLACWQRRHENTAE